MVRIVTATSSPIDIPILGWWRMKSVLSRPRQAAPAAVPIPITGSSEDDICFLIKFGDIKLF
jgi:hypothetical protein